MPRPAGGVNTRPRPIRRTRRGGGGALALWARRMHSGRGAPPRRTEFALAEFDLNGQLLIAMPGMGDPRFEHAVVLICAHSEKGAMGLVLNKSTGDILLSDLLEQLSITPVPEAADRPIQLGGPVENAKGFVLHDRSYDSPQSTIRVDDNFAMTATLDILEEIANSRGPSNFSIHLGYAGWGPGQIEDEIARNEWLNCDSDAELVFGTGDGEMWAAALERLGVSAAPGDLSGFLAGTPRRGVSWRFRRAPGRPSPRRRGRIPGAGRTGRRPPGDLHDSSTSCPRCRATVKSRLVGGLRRLLLAGWWRLAFSFLRARGGTVSTPCRRARTCSCTAGCRRAGRGRWASPSDHMGEGVAGLEGRDDASPEALGSRASGIGGASRSAQLERFERVAGLGAGRCP